MLTCPTRFCQQDGVCDKASAPSVSSITRLLRGPTNQTRPGDDPRRNHSIDGILGEFLFKIIFSVISSIKKKKKKNYMIFRATIGSLRLNTFKSDVCDTSRFNTA